MHTKEVSKWYLIVLTIGAFAINLIVYSYVWVEVLGLQGVALSDAAPVLVLLLAVMPYGLWRTLYEESFSELWSEEQTISLKTNLVVLNLMYALILAFFGWAVFLRQMRTRGFI